MKVETEAEGELWVSVQCQPGWSKEDVLDLLKHIVAGFESDAPINISDVLTAETPGDLGIPVEHKEE